MVSFSRAVAAAALLAVPVATYKSIANCVPGTIVKDLPYTKGKIGAYSLALKAILPDVYGDLELLTESPASSGACIEAATQINLNQVLLDNVFQKFEEMHEVGVSDAEEIGDPEKDYLFVFDNKHYVSHEMLANCVPGTVVGQDLLGKTKGKVGIYSIILKAIMPTYGDLEFLSKGELRPCLDAMNAINSGNLSYMEKLTSGTGKIGHSMKEVGMLESLTKADQSSNYLFVFGNKNWNSTYSSWALVDGLEQAKSFDDSSNEQEETTAEPTEQPEETTAEPTEQPEETSAEPTEQPEETTAEPTEQPEETTAEPTEQPEETSAEPTEQPEETTAEPTDQPEETTVEPTEQPEETTAKPTEQRSATEQPEETTAEPTEQPEDTTAEPTEQRSATEQPEETTAEPTEQPEAAAETTEQPAETTAEQPQVEEARRLSEVLI